MESAEWYPSQGKKTIDEVRRALTDVREEVRDVRREVLLLKQMILSFTQPRKKVAEEAAVEVSPWWFW